jgi:hypothetical protein
LSLDILLNLWSSHSERKRLRTEIALRTRRCKIAKQVFRDAFRILGSRGEMLFDGMPAAFA